MVAENKFVEHARFGRNYYGTSVRAVEDVEGKVGEEGKRTCVLDIEMEVRLSDFCVSGACCCGEWVRLSCDERC